MNALRLLVLTGGFLILSIGGHAMIHSISVNSEVPPPTSHQQTRAKETSDVSRTQEAELLETNEAARAEDVRALQVEVARLNTELAALTTRLWAAESTAPAEGFARRSDRHRDTDERAMTPPVRFDELVGNQNELAYERIGALDANFDSQILDARWSPKASEFVQEALEREELANTDVLHIECREAECRLSVAHDDPADRDAFVSKFPSLVSTMLPGATFNYIRRADGRSETVVYLHRKGS